VIAPARLSVPRPFRLALRADEAADALGISPRTLAAMVAAGTIPYTRIGKRNLRFPVAALQKWLDGQTTMPAGMVHNGPAQQADFPDDLADDGGAAANPAAMGS
jgi:excisionase family DNA binding protein